MLVYASSRDKEELGSLVSNQSNKINKLEADRMDYQKKIIEVSGRAVKRVDRNFGENLFLF